MAESLATKFKEANFAIAHLKNGNEVVEEMIIQKPDIVILDILLPGKNGFEFLKDIKGKKETEKIPVIILSNLAQEKDIERGMSLGAKDYLIKPEVSLSEVVDRTKECLAKIEF